MSHSLIAFLLALYSVAHGVIVLIIVIGAGVALLGLFKRRPKLERAYLVVVIGTILSFVITRSCFLTDWEKALRQQFLPETAYENGFISHYMSYLGFDLNDWHVLYFLVTMITLGLLGTIFHHVKNRS